MSSPELNLYLEVRMRIQYGSGWPFSTRRPFYILYRWETDISEWSAVYRSEVLTEPSQTPDAQGAMVFRIVNLPLSHVIGVYSKRPLRIEFFHYKMSKEKDAKMLAYVETSIVDLRRTMSGSRMLMVLNIFPTGELVGNAVLQQSKVSSSKYFFSLMANFGGPVSGTLVYFGVGVVDVKRVRGAIRRARPLTEGGSQRLRPHELRPFFTISRYTPMTSSVTTTTTNPGRPSNTNNNNMQNPDQATTVTTTVTTTTTTTTSNSNNSTAAPQSLPKFTWEEVYRSEHATRHITSRPYMFRVAKLTERKLNGLQDTRIIAVNLYRPHRDEPVLFAYFLTTVHTLLHAPLGSVFPLISGSSDTNANANADREEDSSDEVEDESSLGYAKLDISMKRGARLSFSVTVFLGQPTPEGANIETIQHPR